MKLPEDLLHSLTSVTGFNKEAFIQVHEKAEPVTSIRINRAKSSIVNHESLIDDTVENFSASINEGWFSSAVPWCSTGYYLKERPSFTFDPLFHAGCYYVQEASSMFLEQAFTQLADLSQPLKVLDLCAAPGGKSTHIQSLLSKESLLVSNEVIKQRSYVLSDNIIKWGCTNVFVTNNDPKKFQQLPGYFDVLVVDAPCSGSGLFRRDAEAMQEWSLNAVNLCSQRQQRILADVLPALKKDGLLIYSTCSYSAEEDEAIMDWLVRDMEMENLPLTIDRLLGIVETTSACGSIGYRFYPDKIKGEGFFLACFRKTTEEKYNRLKIAKPEMASEADKKIVSQWIGEEGYSFLWHKNNLLALPDHLMAEFYGLQTVLQIIHAGVTLGVVLKNKLVPHHALAQNNLLSKSVSCMDLAYDNAIKYLQRMELSKTPEVAGWQVVRYKNYPLGWVNALSNRMNNYYPKEIRILKRHNTSVFKK